METIVRRGKTQTSENRDTLNKVYEVEETVIY